MFCKKAVAKNFEKNTQKNMQGPLKLLAVGCSTLTTPCYPVSDYSVTAYECQFANARVTSLFIVES